MKATATLIGALLLCGNASAQTVGDLAKSLDAISSVCIKLAQEHSASNSTEQFKAKLEDDSERLRIRREVDLYSIGHGRQNTANYMATLMRESANKSADRHKELGRVAGERSDQVDACVVDALEKGKQEHKRRRYPSPAAKTHATDLTSAWIANTETISLASPEGEAESRNSWRREKARAELQ